MTASALARPSSLARSSSLVALIGLSLAGCARHVAVAPVAALPAPVAPPPRPAVSPLLATVVPPPRGPDGRYRTINSGIGAEQTVWHLRSALNVAAIGCRGPENAALVAAYNSMLSSRRLVLTRARQAVEAQFRAQGTDWQDANDRYMTRLYNYFSMPSAHQGFCRAAADAASRLSTLPADGLPAFAETELPKLEAPILAVYAEADRARTELAEWESRYGAGAAGALPAAVAPPAPTPTPVAQLRSARAPRLGYRVGPLLDWQPGTAVATRD